MLRYAAGARRLVLWIDDVQWGPIDTPLAAEVGRAPWPAGAFVLLSYRPPTTGDGPCVKVLGDVVTVTATLALSPLEDEDARALIEPTPR